MTPRRDATVPRSVAKWAGRLGLSYVLAAGLPALAADIYTDSFTGVIISGNVGGNLGPFSRQTVDGPTHFDYTKTADTTHFSPGWLIAEGDAHFGTLGARVEIGGDSASYGSVGVYFNDIHTPTGGALGTSDSFQLVFSLDGWVDVDYNGNSDPQTTIEHVARATIAANKYASTGSFESLGGDTVEVNYFYAIGPSVTTPFPPYYVSVTVPFVYGDTFTLRTTLFVEAFMDTRFLSTSGPPTFYSYGDGSIDRVRADFLNTAKLIAVVNDTTPGFALAGQSGFNYQAIVVTEVSPIPEPGMAAMFAMGCIVLGAFRLRRAAAV